MDRSLYGRKWQLKIVCTDGTTFVVGKDGIGQPESLRCTFDINYPGYEGWYFSEFNIWNPTSAVYNKVIKEGAEVFFYAGYSEGLYGQIFGGQVFQSIFTRENVTDYKLTIYCIDGARLFRDNIVSINTVKGYTEQTLTNAVAAKARSKISTGSISNAFDENDQPKPRGTTVFCAPIVKLREIARNNNAQLFMSLGRLNMRKTYGELGEEIVINPDTGLIGTPTQTEFGIDFRTLLNPKIILAEPVKYIKLDMSGINYKALQAAPNQKKVGIIPQNGYFMIGGVRHSGDTRGNDWYTDVNGYAFGKAGLQLTVPQMLKDYTVDEINANG